MKQMDQYTGAQHGKQQNILGYTSKIGDEE